MKISLKTVLMKIILIHLKKLDKLSLDYKDIFIKNYKSNL